MRLFGIAPCADCGKQLGQYTSGPRCVRCRRAMDAKRVRPRPRATHIAGYVPPRGSIAAMFHGRIVQYH